MFRPALALSALALLAPTAPAQNAHKSSIQTGLGVAQAQVPGGILIRARTEVKNNVTIQGFYFWEKGRVIEIEVSRDNMIIKDTQKDGTPVAQDVAKMIEKQTKAKAKLPDGRLFEIAAQALKDAPLKDLNYQIVNGKLVLQVGDLTIDAQTGKVLPKAKK